MAPYELDAAEVYKTFWVRSFFSPSVNISGKQILVWLVAVYYEGQSCNQKNRITLDLNKKKLPIYLISAYNKAYMGYLHSIFVVGS